MTQSNDDNLVHWNHMKRLQSVERISTVGPITWGSSNLSSIFADLSVLCKAWNKTTVYCGGEIHHVGSEFRKLDLIRCEESTWINAIKYARRSQTHSSLTTCQHWILLPWRIHSAAAVEIWFANLLLRRCWWDLLSGSAEHQIRKTTIPTLFNQMTRREPTAESL